MGIVVHPELGGAAPRPLPPPPRPMLDLGGPRLIVGHTSGPGPMRRPGGHHKDRAVLDRLGMAPVRLVFPSPEEWADPSLLLRRAYAPPEAA